MWDKFTVKDKDQKGGLDHTMDYMDKKLRSDNGLE